MAYGVKKLQISCVVEDDKVGTDFLEEKITEFEDFVRRMCFGNKSSVPCSCEETMWLVSSQVLLYVIFGNIF